MKKSKEISVKRIAWIKEQGYDNFSHQSIQELAFGNRFAYRLGLVFLIPGVILANIPLLAFMNVVAFLNIFLPYHLFDYLYNHLVRRWTNGPQLPPRSTQFKFASIMATMIIATTIYFIHVDMMIAVYIIGGPLIIGSTLASFIDFCFLARLYNFLADQFNRS